MIPYLPCSMYLSYIQRKMGMQIFLGFMTHHSLCREDRQVELKNVLTRLIREQRLHGLDEEEVEINIKLDGRPLTIIMTTTITIKL